MNSRRAPRSGLRSLTAAAALALGGSVPPAAQTPQRPTFQSSAQLVEVDVRVAGADGRFIGTLTRDDFEVFEDGRPQPIEVMLVVSDGVTPADAAATSRADAPNRSRPHQPHTWVFAFDVRHLSPGGLTRTRDALIGFLDTGFAGGDAGGVLEGGVMANGRLTTDRAELKAAALAIRPSSDVRARAFALREWPAFRSAHEAWRIDGPASDRELLEQLRERACLDRPETCYRFGVISADDDRRSSRSLIATEAEEHVRNEIRQKARRIMTDLRAAAHRTLVTLGAVVSGLARLPGRKSVVLFSEGFVFDEAAAELREITGAAARAGVTFYSVDARGLDRSGQGLLDQPGAMQLSAAGEARFDENSDGTNALAVDTGGLALRNDNDFGRALGHVAADARNYYLLAYRPENTAFDGRFRRIQVRVKRPGLIVRARAGYIAAPPVAGPASTPAAAALRPGGPSPGLTPGVLPAGPPPGMTPVHLRAPALPVPETPVERPAAPPSPAERLRQLRPATDSADSSLASRGWAAYARGDIHAAGALLTEAAREPDARPWVHYALGFARLAESDVAGAARAWERVRSAAPDFNPVYFDLADAYLQGADTQASVRVLRAAQQRWPADPDVHNALGVVQLRRGALDDAVESFQQAVTVAPSDPAGYFNLGRVRQIRYLQSRRYNAALRRWFAKEEERDRAIDAFRQCVALGGPLAASAREALVALEWR